MPELIKNLFNLNMRQSWATDKIFSALAEISRSVASPKKMIALFAIIVQLFSFIVSDTPVTPFGKQLDLTGYTEVFCDDFDAQELNTDVWHYRSSGERRCGYNSASQVKLENGNLIITGEYRNEDGEFGPGWYSGMISLVERYTYGYFEIRCICNKDKGFWSAFWLQSPNAYNPDISRGGIGGAEIDIFEAFGANESSPEKVNAFTHTVHCAGMEGDTSGGLNSGFLGSFRGNDIFNEYNTIGLEWTEDEYIFYINGVESVRTSYADGVSKTPEELIVSLELPNELNFSQDYETRFIVDYVKVYQK